MKIFKCPYCKKQVFRWWELFTLFSPFWFRGRTCMNCNEKLRFNWNFIVRIMLYMSLAVLVGFVIGFFFDFDSILFSVLIFALFIAIPLSSGQSLVMKRE
jgi:hypothetical protein